MMKKRKQLQVSGSHRKLTKSSHSADSFLIPSHPLGIKPLGNLWTRTNDSVLSVTTRETSLGLFSIFNDECLLDVLSYLDGCSAAMLSCCSQYLYAFCSYNELWREWTLRDFTQCNFQSSWKNTYRKAFLRKKGRYDDCTDLTKIRCEQVYSDVLYRTWCTVHFHFPSYAVWWKRDNVPRMHTKDLDVDTFIQQFEKQSMPLVIQGLVTQWPAYEKWNRHYFIQHSHDFQFAVGPTQMTMQEYIHYMESNEDINPLYLFEKRFQQLPFASDYQVPEYFKDRDLFSLVEKHYNKRPDHSWLIYGPPRSGSRFHIDPNQTCAWNAVIQGRKKWVLFPPPPHADSPSPPGVFPSEDYSQVISPASLIEWFTNFYEEAKERNDIIECVVQSGELLFIPRGWWHIVLNLEESIAITENYVSESNLSHVLQFFESKPHQISGWHDDQDLQSLLIDAIQRERPNLLTRLDSDDRSLSHTKHPNRVNMNRKATDFRFNFASNP
ncbi:hypothetical protein GpartN1_g7659.t1 [Galdieria partita]|uniref:JmjC domain-containing protein n=1 Tax=Galdieria partita TaxID=83374 RepID=A0A9C7Q3K2_9RHOD|nr:hypothetical protein GpartN1_g7659.t1 [Galdieria partita]